MSRAPPSMQRTRSVSNSGATGTSAGGAAAAAASAATSAAPKYKALTRDVLLSVCRKHFALKPASAASSAADRSKVFRGTSLQAKLEYAGQHSGGYDYSNGEVQTKMETLDRYLKRATHLQCDGLALTHCFPVAELAIAAGLPPTDPTLAQARSLRVLYLHENHLTSIDDFSFCGDTLSHLYLQNNAITKMQNLLQLRALEKLYLTGNNIAMLEGFAAEEQQPQQSQQAGPDGSAPPRRAPAPFNLVELHMDAQKLPAGIGLQLSVPSIQALCHSLTVLSLNHNGMDSDGILPLSLLSRLISLSLTHNRITDAVLVAEMCSYLPELSELDLRMNPLNSGPTDTAVTHKKYRDRIIMSSRSISQKNATMNRNNAKLDDKEVPPNQREYLHGLAEQRRLKRAAAAAAPGAVPREPSAEERKFAALHAPPAFPYTPNRLTMRTTASTTGGGGGMGGAGGRALHGSSSSASFGGANLGATFEAAGGGGAFPVAEASPFLDDDYYDAGGVDPSSSFAPGPSDPSSFPSSSSSSLLSQAGGSHTASAASLDGLLHSRGLVSAIGGLAIQDPEEAKAARATMNAQNQAPNGWDGGRTQNVARDPVGASQGGAAAAARRRTPAEGAKKPTSAGTKAAAARPAGK